MTTARRALCRSFGVALAAGLVCGSAAAQKHAAVSVKPGAPLAIAAEAPPAPMPGVAFAVRIQITATADLIGVQLTLTARDGLEVTPGAIAVGALARGAAWTGTVDVLPLVAGRHRLDLFVTAESPVFGHVARSVAKPIVVGDAGAGAAAANNNDVDRLRRMPATETLR